MFNFFELCIIPTFLSRFEVKKVLVIGLSNELLMNEIISYCINNHYSLYSIDSKINIRNLISGIDDLDENYLDGNIKHFNDDTLNILPNLEPFDAIFINDDPNWYTVYNELNLIKKNNPNFPLVFVCNNKYPHKRRDSYINPNKIPKEYKNECCNDLPVIYKDGDETKQTMIKDGFCHAIHQDTPKNGVLTAIEDFLKENLSLKVLEINPLEGITLIYEPSHDTNIKIESILGESTESDYTPSDLSDKFIENSFLLRYVSEMNLLKDDLEMVDEFKSEIKKKDSELTNYENQLKIKNDEMKYKDSQIYNVESQMSLKETQIKSIESKLESKTYEAKSKDDKIMVKEKEMHLLNKKLKDKDYEIEIVNNRLINLESTFLENKEKLENTQNQLNNANNQLKILKEKQNNINLKDSKSLDNKYSTDNNMQDSFESQNKRENSDIKNNEKFKSSKKFSNYLSYVYIIFKSKPNEIKTNIRLYNSFKDSDYFDSNYYLNKYPDISKGKFCKYFSPELHYVCNGFDEGRKFNNKSINKKNKKELLEFLKNDAP
ncbi:hypothetical protein [uncultured Methanobrevibacter sp.]|uniref:hypothetical protein n=1 Tax=uncultured Methanobrevibacter sp. TaxID=253161 RepID=UPI0025E377F1|nr:hypothetical protein [uncultured Methanobrevibacter sp.]